MRMMDCWATMNACESYGVEMADHPFTLEVVRASSVSSLRPRVKLLLRVFATKGGPFGGSRPWLVVRNAQGEVQPLWEEANWDEAKAKRDRMLRELDEIGTEAWCERYNVPATFADPDDSWRRPSTT